VGVERQAGLVDLERGELVTELAQQLDVDDELLVAGDEATLEPAAECITKLAPARNVGINVISDS